MPAVAEIVGVPRQTITDIINKAEKRQMSDFGKDFKPFIKKAEWLDTFYPHGGDEKYKHSKVPNENLRTMPVTKKESARARKRS